MDGRQIRNNNNKKASAYPGLRKIKLRFKARFLPVRCHSSLPEALRGLAFPLLHLPPQPTDLGVESMPARP